MPSATEPLVENAVSAEAEGRPAPTIPGGDRGDELARDAGPGNAVHRRPSAWRSRTRHRRRRTGTPQLPPPQRTECVGWVAVFSFILSAQRRCARSLRTTILRHACVSSCQHSRIVSRRSSGRTMRKARRCCRGRKDQGSLARAGTYARDQCVVSPPPLWRLGGCGAPF